MEVQMKKHWLVLVFVFTILSLIHRRKDLALLTTLPSSTFFSPRLYRKHDEGSTSIMMTLSEAQQASSSSSSSHPTRGSNCSSWKGSHEVPVRPTVYVCGFDLWNFAQNIFPDFQYGGRLTSSTTSWCPQDVLVQGGLDGPCDVSQIVVQETFPGKVLYVNSEARKGAAEKHRLSDRFYQIGPTEEEHHSVGDEPTATKTRTMPVYFGAIFWSATTTPDQRGIFLKESRVETTIVRHKDKMVLKQEELPQEERKQAVIFLVSNCLKERREAATMISNILRVDHGPKCGPTSDDEHQRTLPFKEHHGRGSYIHNYVLYSKYQFCLVMENTVTEGYLTEKIFLAYLGGCVPIYWGTQEVFQIFHPDSFIFYDIHHPELALSELTWLSSNITAYHAKVHAPILVNGTDTWRKYLSLMDGPAAPSQIEGSLLSPGWLKQRIRDMMQI